MSNYSFIDLHIHTIHSREPGCDDSVETVFKDAQKIADRSGKDCLIAITDHNTVSGISEARALAQSGKYPNVKIISGCEFTVDMSELNGMFGGNRIFRNMHILAYGFDENHPELVEHSRKGGNIRYSKLVNMIKNAGGYLVVAHPGLIKVSPKYAEAYQGTELKDELHSIAQNARSSNTILRNVPGGISLFKVLFHKLQKMSGGIMVGMERFHPDNYSWNFDNHLHQMCEEEGLIETAGSDFHGYHLHTDFSVGNPFRKEFQEYYKDTLKDCTDLQNGIHVSYLPGIELLTGEEQIAGKEISLISGNGEPITYEQYNIVSDAYRELRRKRHAEEEKNSANNQNQQKQNNNKNKHHGNKKRHRHKNKHHRHNMGQIGRLENGSGEQQMETEQVSFE